MAEKIKKSKTAFLSLAKTVKPEEKIMAARKALLDMKEKLLAEGLGKSLPEDLARPFEIGDEGDRAEYESANEVSILLSAPLHHHHSIFQKRLLSPLQRYLPKRRSRDRRNYASVLSRVQIQLLHIPAPPFFLSGFRARG